MRICDEHLDSRYNVEIVDLLENPKLAAGDEIVAIPTLVRRLPAPMRKIIGDLSDSDRVLVGLQLRPGTLTMPAKHEARRSSSSAAPSPNSARSSTS